MTNPLLSNDFLIPFDEIQPEHITSGIDELLKTTETQLEALISTTDLSYQGTLGALEGIREPLSRAMTLAYHLNSVATTTELRDAFNEAYPKYSAFMAKVPLNDDLWQLIKRYSETEEAKNLSGVYKRHLDETLRNFKHAGADLEPEQKKRVEAIKVELSGLQTKFSQNVLDSSNSFELIVTDKADLAGLPESALNQAKLDAEAKGIEGYRFTLQIPSYLPAAKHLENRDLRQTMQTAYVSRASSGEFNNRPLIPQILQLRKELSQILGYQDFADYRLEDAMVGSGKAALSFESDIYEATVKHWNKELESFKAFAKSDLGLDELKPWDIPFVSEKLRQKTFDFDDEALRPYFPLDGVLTGMFDIAQKLFGITITQKENAKVWHEDVQFFDIHDKDNVHIASFYADFFPREDKRGGAWMNSFITGYPTEGGFSPHLGLMASNFTKPQGDTPALITHREVQTTFHEFGHLLHHCLSRVEVKSLAGTNVPWDFVELPSQILENWTWEREALDMFARHYETGKTIPDELFNKLIKARTFMEANAQMRQLSFGTVDLILHTKFDPQTDGDPIEYGNKIIEKYVIEPDFAHDSFLTAFSHIFAGGYAAGYYSYKWSEVLDADAFSRFKDEGVFNPETGQAFVDTILSQGGSKDAAELYRDFMGRDPKVTALLERNLGISSN